jgi:hypothetical protein
MKHMFNVKPGEELEHAIITDFKKSQSQRAIQAIDIDFEDAGSQCRIAMKSRKIAQPDCTAAHALPRLVW